MGLYHKNEGELTITLANDSVIALKGAKDSDCRRGPALDFLVFDEAQDVEEGIYDLVFRPLLTGRNGESIISGSKKNGSWFLKEWIAASRGQKPDAKALRFPSYSNPLVPKQEWNDIKNDLYARNKSHIWEQEYEADPFSDKNLDVDLKFVEFDRRIHVIAPFNFTPNYRHFRGIDWGISNTHPFVCVWLAVSPDGSIYVYEEYETYGKSAEIQAREVIRKTGLNNVEMSVMDPACWNRESDGKCIAHRLREAGITKILPGKREDRADSSANTIKNYLRPVSGPPRLHIFSTCTLLIDQLENLRWQNKTGDDRTDALGYILVFLSRCTFETKTDQAKSAVWTMPIIKPQPFKLDINEIRQGDNGLKWNSSGYIS